MKNWIVVAVIVLVGSACVLAARAQGSGGALVVVTCGTLPLAFTPGATRQMTVNTSGQVCQ